MHIANIHLIFGRPKPTHSLRALRCCAMRKTQITGSVCGRGDPHKSHRRFFSDPPNLANGTPFTASQFRTHRRNNRKHTHTAYQPEISSSKPGTGLIIPFPFPFVCFRCCLSTLLTRSVRSLVRSSVSHQHIIAVDVVVANLLTLNRTHSYAQHTTHKRVKPRQLPPTKAEQRLAPSALGPARRNRWPAECGAGSMAKP